MSKGNHIDRYVANVARQRRESLGLLQSQVAERMGVSPQQISKYEHGEDRLSAGKLYDLARALNVTPAFFFEGLPN